jgi:hypothetical protein
VRALRWIAAGLLLVPAPAPAQPVGTGFTYQGRLMDGGGPANGGYDLQFVVYDAPTGGLPAGPVQTLDDVLVAGGLFTVRLDVGAVFGDATRWLEVGVRPGASTGPYALLSPRQELTSVPAALAAPWPGVSGKPPGFADGVDDDSGGDVSSVTAGTGLTGGGASGELSFALSFGSGGGAGTASRGDHTHFGQEWVGAAPGAPGLAVLGNSPIGLYTQAGLGSGAIGLRATATSDGGTGVSGTTLGAAGIGVLGLDAATSGASSGVEGQTLSGDGKAVFGRNASTAGFAAAVEGQTGFGQVGSPTGYGVVGRAVAPAGVNYGVYGEAVSPLGYAGFFAGHAHVTGTLSKSADSFKIDHPLAPEDKYLYHSFVESPDMKNVYDGLVTTDAEGLAVVELPRWFEALNRDFRYQLTVIGQLARAVVARRMAGNRFVIRTDKPRVEVSWQVTGIRRDPFAEKHRIPVEEEKEASR